MHKHIIYISILVFGITGCKRRVSPTPGQTQTVKVLATTGMIADLAKQLAGSQVSVGSLMPVGVDPHLYKASESDVRKLQDADLILYNGLKLEGKMGDILAKLARRRSVVAVADVVPKEKLRAPPEFAGAYDPHIWFDVSLWVRAIEPISKALVSLTPKDASEIRRRAKRLSAALTDLDRWVTREIQRIPPGQRTLVTAHDAFGYFGRRYGMDVVGLQGISTVTQAGIGDVTRVVDLIVKRRIGAIFVESSVPKRTIEAVVQACKAKGHDVSVGGQLYSDSMGRVGTPAGTYDGMVRHNVRTIVAALSSTRKAAERVQVGNKVGRDVSR